MLHSIARTVAIAGLAFALGRIAAAQIPPPNEAIEAGHQYFEQKCAFCHGRDAGGGESGPDLTRSKLVADDVKGDKIGPLVRAGRADKGMPAFAISDADLSSLAAFIHAQKTIAETRKGGRKGVDVSDLQTGDVNAGKAYFDGAGTCSTCHSASGDLAGIAKKYKGLQLEQHMLYPRDAVGKVTVQLKSGESITGKVAYLDEFTVGLKDADGRYHSWSTKLVKFTVDDPASKHADLLSKYSDDDIHNLMAYLQTLQ